jgi:hypothetical protein
MGMSRLISKHDRMERQKNKKRPPIGPNSNLPNTSVEYYHYTNLPKQSINNHRKGFANQSLLTADRDEQLT